VIFGQVRHVANDQPFDERDHLRDVVRRFRVDLGRLNAQILTIRMKDRRDRLGDFPNGFSLFVRAPDDLVVDVGQVHHLTHFPTAPPQRPTQQVTE
jgi:hypothetical protein